MGGRIRFGVLGCLPLSAALLFPPWLLVHPADASLTTGCGWSFITRPPTSPDGFQLQPQIDAPVYLVQVAAGGAASGGMVYFARAQSRPRRIEAE